MILPSYSRKPGSEFDEWGFGYENTEDHKMYGRYFLVHRTPGRHNDWLWLPSNWQVARTQ